MSAQTLTYQCPACGGTLRYDSEISMLRCDFCDSSFEVAEIEARYAAKQAEADARAASDSRQAQEGTRSAFDEMGDVGGASSALTEDTINEAVAVGQEAGDPISAYLKRAAWNEEERAGLRSYSCSACGAALTCDATTAVSKCPYCGNTSVIPGTLSDEARPDWVIPFKLSKEEAKASLNEYYKGKKFLPKAFVDKNNVEHIQGVYVPFWFFDGMVEGAGTYVACNESAHTEGDWRIVTREVHDVYRDGSLSFSRVPVDASAKMPDAHMDAIEPFDYSELQPFSPAFLPGYLAERYDEAPDQVAGRAQRRMKGSFKEEMRASVRGYSSVSERSFDSQCSIEGISQSLLPVWMLHTTYENEDYLFAMNGQTGRFIGDLPVSKGKVVQWFFIIFAVLAAVMGALDLGVIHFEDTLMSMGFDVFVPLIVSVATCYVFYTQMKTAREQSAARPYIAEGGLELRNAYDRYLRTDVRRERIGNSG